MSQKGSAQADKNQVEVCQENERLQSMFYSSRKEFNNEFKKCVGTPKAKEFLFYILGKLRETVLAGETDDFRQFLSLVNCVSGLDPKIYTYSQESENPLKDASLIILICKHNRLEILKWLLRCGKKTLNILFFGEPEVTDDEKHSAFYYAIRSGNIEIFDTLISEWPDKYFASTPGKLDYILAKAYAELKLRNVLLSDEVEIHVENKLLDLRFFSNSSSQGKCSKNNLESLKERIKLVTEKIDFLKTNYSDDQKVDDRFLFVAKFIAQNIHILKRQLKSTYDKLPWEEIEFCLICFVLSYIKRKEINLFYKWTLNKVKILTYLKSFANKLNKVTGLIKCNVDKLTELPKLQREQVIAEIRRKSPEFKELYSDYQKLRDVCSLEKICDYLKLGLSADPEEREGQLIITRVIQVIGEYLKNTLESPKLSHSTSEHLLLSLPSDTRNILNDLRNALSHSYALSKRMEFEDKASLTFFTGVQKDMKKIDSFVTGILHRNKMKNITEILERIPEIKGPTEIVFYSEILSSVALNERIPENYKIKEHEKLEKLMKKLSDTIVDKTDYEKERFKQINEIIDSTRGQSKDFMNKYKFGLTQLEHIIFQLTSDRLDKNFIESLKISVGEILKYITPDIEADNIEKIIELSKEIYHSAILRANDNTQEEITRLIYDISWIIQFGNDLRWIEKLREKITGKTSVPIQKQGCTNEVSENKYKNKFKLKQRELQSILSSNGFCSPASKNLAPYRENKEMQSIVEMLVLDIMSILETSEVFLEDNHTFLNDTFPLLMGKSLRNHLAHDNALVDLLPLDPVAAVILNAQKLINVGNLLENNKIIGKSVENSLTAYKRKFNRELCIVSDQDLMFNALSKGDLLSLKHCLQNGADIYARNVNLRTSPHFASMTSNLDVLKYVHGLGVNFNVQDISGQTPLHIAAELGTLLLVEFLIEETGLPVDNVDKSGKTPLHYAAKNGHVEVVRTFLKNKASTLTLDLCRYIPMHYAIRNNHLDVVKLMIKEDKDFDINEIIGGRTPLRVAAGSGHLEMVEFLLQNKADVNVSNGKNELPLHKAAREGFAELVIALINKGDVNSQTLEGLTALHLAALRGNEQVVCSLLQHGARADISDKTTGSTPLHMGAGAGNTTIVASLLKNNADPNASGFAGETPLLIAACAGHLEIVADLLKHGADIYAKDKASFTSLHYAAKIGHLEISKLLICRGAKIDAKTADGLTPLHLAATDGHKEVVDFLIVNKADINAKSISGDTPLHFAAIAGRIHVIKALIEKKAEINETDNEGVTPLLFAAHQGHKDVVNLLIKNKAKVRIKCARGFTPLDTAILGGHYDIVQILIKNKAQINVASFNDRTPIFLAVQTGHKDIVKLLLAIGADINANHNNSTPLLCAVELNQKEIVEVLSKNGANVNGSKGAPIVRAVDKGFKDIVEILLKYRARTDSKLNDSSTLLHLAASIGNKQIVNMLIKKGMEVDVKTDSDRTPLHMACQQGHDGVVEVLLANGANVDLMCVGETPLYAAAGYGHDRVVKVLLDSGAKINLTDSKNRTPVEAAVIRGHLEVVKILLMREVGVVNKSDGRTLLHKASQQNNVEMVKYLVQVGADINAKSALERKPVVIAAREGRKDIVEFFISNGISIDDVDSSGITILHHAAFNGCLDVVKYLVANGAAVNCKSNDGRTPMHAAAKVGSKPTITVLLEYGGFYNSVDKFNNKPSNASEDKSVITLFQSIEKLFDAVKRKSRSEVESCLKEGAFVDAKNAEDRTPLLYAAWKGNVDVLNILLENGANPNLVCEKGFTPLHYAAKFSHLNAILALLGAGAIYNAASDGGKTPLDFTCDKSVGSLLRLVNTLFEKVQSGDVRIMNDLNRLNDIKIVKAIMNASNKENHSLIVAAVYCKFPKIIELKAVFQPNVVDEMNRFFAIMQQGDYPVGLSILKSVFEKRKEIFGLNNPATLDTEGNIAQVLIKLGKYQESFSILETVYAKQTRILGMYHEDTLRTKSSIALVLYMQQKNKEAFNIFKEVYAKQKELFGPNRSDTLDTQHNMGLAMEKLGKYEEALNLFQETYEKHKSIYGENDDRTISAQHNIGVVLTSQKKYEEALKIYRTLLGNSKIVLGLNHPDTVKNLHCIGMILSNQKKYRDALKTYQEVLDIQRDYLGPMHPDTLITQFNMAATFAEQGKRLEVIKIYKHIMDPVKLVLGPQHPTFLIMSQNMEQFNLASKMGQGYGAAEFLQQLQRDMNTAASSGDVKTVERLIKNGFDVNDKDVDGRSPLHFAISGRHMDVVNLLLKHGADPTQVTNKGNTPLHTAVSAGRKEIVDILLQHVAQDKLSNFINIGTLTSETTSLHVAAKNGSLEIVKSLLKYGAIYNITNKEGKTPVEVSHDKSVYWFLKLTDEIFKATAEGNLNIVCKLEKLKKDEFIAINRARNNERKTLLEVAQIRNILNVIILLSQLAEKAEQCGS